MQKAAGTEVHCQSFFDARPALDEQSLALRKVSVERQEVFGGGGKDLGAALSLIASTLDVESVDFVGNTQRGVGAGVVFAVASNASFLFARFELNRNLGLGAGVLTASARSRVVFSHAQFLDNFAEDQMGLRASRVTEQGKLLSVKRVAENGKFPLTIAQFQCKTCTSSAKTCTN
jgi:hypothetical protein